MEMLARVMKSAPTLMIRRPWSISHPPVLSSAFPMCVRKVTASRIASTHPIGIRYSLGGLWAAFAARRTYQAFEGCALVQPGDITEAVGSLSVGQVSSLGQTPLALGPGTVAVEPVVAGAAAASESHVASGRRTVLVEVHVSPFMLASSSSTRDCASGRYGVESLRWWGTRTDIDEGFVAR